jgi:nucleoside-diphosphate kinase
MNLQMTFAMIKSSAVARGQSGAVLDRILGEKMVILGAKRTKLGGAAIDGLYGAHRKKSYWPQLVHNVDGEVIVMMLAGAGVISHWRDILGATDSKLAAPGTLRHQFGNPEVVADNVAHGSDSSAAAERELALFFPDAAFPRAFLAT